MKKIWLSGLLALAVGSFSAGVVFLSAESGEAATGEANVQATYVSDSVQEAYFVYNASGASLYAPFDAATVRTKSGTTTASETGVTLTLSAAQTVTADTYLAFEYVQMVAGANVGISVKLGDVKADGTYYEKSASGALSDAKTMENGVFAPTVSETKGFTGVVYVPMSDFSGLTEYSTVTISASSAYLRMGVGSVYIVNGTSAELNDAAKIYTPETETATAVGENAEVFVLGKGTIKGGTARLSADTVSSEDVNNTDKYGANAAADPLLFHYPQKLVSDLTVTKDGVTGVDYTKLNGMLYYLKNNDATNYWTSYHAFGAELMGDQALNIDKGVIAKNNATTGAQLTKDGAYTAGAGKTPNIVKILASYEGFLYLSLTDASFGNVLPDIGHPYISFDVLNNPSFANCSMTIETMQFLTKPLTAPVTGDNGVTGSATYSNFAIAADKLSFTYDVTYSGITVNVGYDLGGATFNGEAVTVEDVATFTLTKTGLTSAQNDGLKLVSQAKEYDITYHLDGGENHADNVSKFTLNDTIALSEPTKVGYVFAGWYRSAEFLGDPVTSITPTTADIEGINLYAKWDLDTTEYAVNVSHSENGSVTPSVTKGTRGTQVEFTFEPAEGYFVKSAMLDGVQIKGLIEDGKYTATIGMQAMNLDVLFGNDECYELPFGSTYFRVSATKGSVYSPFAAVAVRTDVATGTGGVKATGVSADFTATSAIAFEYFQPVVEASIPLTLTLSDGTNEYTLANNAMYYTYANGKLVAAQAQNGKIVTTGTQTMGICTTIVVPMSSFGITENKTVTSVSFSTDLTTYARHTFGKVYKLNAFTAETLDFSDVIWNPETGTSEKVGTTDNFTLVNLKAGELIAAPGQLTDVSPDYADAGSKAINELIIINIPEGLRNENGNVDIANIKGLVIDMVTTSDVRQFPLMAILDAKYGESAPMHVLSGWETRNATRSALWIFEGGEMEGTVYANQSSAVIEKYFDGKIVLPFSQETFNVKNNAADAADEFPTEIEPYIIIQLLNNTQGCNKSIQINSIEFIDDLTPYATYELDYGGFNAEVETVGDVDYVLAGREVTFVVTPKAGYVVSKATVNDVEVQLTEDLKYTMTVNEDVVFNVTCEAITYTVTYNLDGGVNHADNIASFHSTDASFDLLAPTKEGYNFLGWYDNAEFSGEAVTRIVRGTSENVTLYAKWEKIEEKPAGGCGSVALMNVGAIVALAAFGVALGKKKSDEVNE